VSAPAAWKGAGWELLPEVPLDPPTNVALDEILLEEVAAGRRPPTLRFWRWTRRAVIIGRFQSLRNEVDRDAAAAMGVEVVRRISGGGAMLVEPDMAITYSLYFPVSFVAGMSIQDSYAASDSWAVSALNDAGVAARYVPLNDIACDEGKIGGAAQSRRRDCVLHHVTIAYEMNPADMVRVLRIGREKLSDKGTPSAAKRVHPLRRQTDLPREAIVARMQDAFAASFGLEPSGVSAAEAGQAEDLVRTKFALESWTADIP
jgi:lipoate-protein ligase A